MASDKVQVQCCLLTLVSSKYSRQDKSRRHLHQQRIRQHGAVLLLDGCLNPRPLCTRSPVVSTGHSASLGPVGAGAPAGKPSNKKHHVHVAPEESSEMPSHVW